MQQKSHFVSITEFIDYSSFRPEQMPRAINELLSQAKLVVNRVSNLTAIATWESVVEPLDTACEHISRAWSAIDYLGLVMDTPFLRKIHNEIMPKITEFYAWLESHEGLYQQYQRLEKTLEFTEWKPSRRHVLTLALRNFRLGGVELTGESKKHYVEISKVHAKISKRFSENLLDAVDTWELLICQESSLDGIPNDMVAIAREAAAKDGIQGFRLSLKTPCYTSIIKYANDRELRKKLYVAYNTVASEQSNKALDNSVHIENLLSLRAEKASLLRYPNYAELQLQTRMVRNSEEVIAFLYELAAYFKPYAKRDVAELKSFAAEKLGLPDLYPWDIAYASEKLRDERCHYSEEQVKKYFPETQVLKGLFSVIEELFSIRFTKNNIPVWHPSVKSVSAETQNGDMIGQLYLDLYARTGKQSGALVSIERERREVGDTIHMPIVHVMCNFLPPGEGYTQALLTHNDVITLFHEMGHALHALLSEVKELGAAPSLNMEWDAIEIPSQFMENFCWEWTVFQKISCHIDTGKTMPYQLYKSILDSRSFQRGMHVVRQIELSLFDILVHKETSRLSMDKILDLLDKIRERVSVILPPKWHRMPHSFSHIFSGGYSSGYYSYLWAEVLSADIYEAFKETSAQGLNESDTILNKSLGMLFRREILAVGASRPSIESFIAFRGRRPKMDAFLSHNGVRVSDKKSRFFPE